jgi:hypothetical protein
MPTADAYEWHAKALAGEKPQLTHEPQCGWFLKKEGPGVMTPAVIWLEQPINEETGELMGDEVFLCEIGGVPVDATEAWTWLAGRVISKDEYLARMASLLTGEPLTEAF